LEAGLIFIGPTPEAIEAMGNKRAAKELAVQAGVPVLPGYAGEDQSEVRLTAEAERIGLPVMVKAAAGGGGKGMRVVTDMADLSAALQSAQREAQQAFGSAELLLEKYLARPRHVEVQIFGDAFGNVIHLGERDCSVQRRQQKIIEESPAPGLTAVLREKLGKTAVALARAIQYQNAGTVEFLLDGEQFYFLEMNTRLQVEHPVTEMVTGLDLVEWQIRVADGEPLPLHQHEVPRHGHALEARLYAENPAHEFLPVTGEIVLWREPAGEGIRVESGIQSGDMVSIFYDPMLAKLVAHGPDRKTAVRRLIRALENTTVLGLTTNLPFLADVLRHPAFMGKELNTHFIADHLAEWQPTVGDVQVATTAVALHQFHSQQVHGGYWRNNPNQPQQYRFGVDEEVLDVFVTPSENGYVVESGDWQVACEPFQLLDYPIAQLPITLNGRRQTLTLANKDHIWWVQTRTGVVRLEVLPLLPVPERTAVSEGSLRAPMPGAVLELLVEVGQQVNAGQALLKLEAMKMEHVVKTAVAGTVTAIYFQPGDTVEADAQLLKIESLT
jgi:acetyl/propionyl-CoA carboxylase alpha subunit